MTKPKKFRRPKHSPASIDGVIVGSRGLGTQTVGSYQPKRGQQMPSIGDTMRRSDGFHASRQSPDSLGHGGVEAAEAQALLDEPIMLDDDSGKQKKHYFGHKHPRVRRYFKRGSLLILALIIVVGGFLGWKLEKDISKVFHGNIFSFLHPAAKLRGEDQGRVTILLAGNSADDPGHEGENLTDSIMLVSLDTANNTGYLLSIPRDFWVNYGTNNCSYGNQGRINAIYECGQAINFHQNGYPSGGMGLLVKDVDQYLGVNIGYYALIDYSGLRDAVNAVGGIEFTVNNPNTCYILGRPFNGLYDGGRDYVTGGVLVNLTNGTHLLNGEQALDLARARGDFPYLYPSCGYENNDFTRTQNQRQELLSLKSKILSLGVLSNPAKLSSLLDTFGNSVQTNFRANEILRLYNLSKKIPNSQIQSVALTVTGNGTNYLKSMNINGADVFIPAAGEGNYSDIQSFIQRLNSNNPVVKEDASVVILNASNINGLAAKTATTLTNAGMNVVATGDDTVRSTSAVVVLNSQKSATKSYLQKTFKVTPTTNTAAFPETQNYNADFVIILGEDAATSNTPSQ
jgi:LCP family protein required for cell wall assembly